VRVLVKACACSSNLRVLVKFALYIVSRFLQLHYNSDTLNKEAINLIKIFPLILKKIKYMKCKIFMNNEDKLRNK